MSVPKFWRAGVSLNHLVSIGEEGRRYSKAQSSRDLQVYEKLKFRGLFYRQIGRV